MAIVIKEIVVKTTLGREKEDKQLSPEMIRKLKKEIVQEVIRTLEKKAEWEREW